MVQVGSFKRMTSFPGLLVLSLFLFSLQGCGGGSGSSSTPDLTIDNPSVVEGNTGDTTTLTFTLALTEAIDSDLTVDFATVDGTAEAGEDYTARSGESVTIRAGDTSAQIIIDIGVDDDAEADETFTLQISNPQGAIVSSSSQSLTATGTITNDDNASKGYFAGSATLNGTEYTDLMALVYEQRILLFSPSANMQYDLAMTTYDGTDYSGTVEVYVDGSITQEGAVTVTGSTDLLVLSGTFGGAGTGFGVGSFSVTYDVNNNKGATLARIEANPNFWTGNIYGIDKDANGVYGNDTGAFSTYGSIGGYSGWDDNNEECGYGEFVSATLDIPDVDTNIYKLEHKMEYGGVGNCNTTYVTGSGDPNHTGFAAVIDDAGTDDELVYAFNNGEFALFAVMHH